VNWLPWGDEGFEKARQENKPVFLSIGYAACHWCHVMAHESFEDATIAALMNEHFVCIKVDREEHPDVDYYYIQAVQSLTGQGGWPLSAFLTPERKVFFGGTYWPPRAKWGRPGFSDVLRAVADDWKERSAEFIAGANELHDALMRLTAVRTQDEGIAADLAERSLRAAEENYDPIYGGFGSAPKFPHPLTLAMLLRLFALEHSERALEMARHTLQRMAQGGIYDQIGGGFHRYSTDARWTVPHFEKMLYDNALLAPVYFNAWSITGEAEFRRIGQEILDWALREMALDGGGFASSLDADSDGKEGTFYLWAVTDIEDALGTERGLRFCRMFDLTDSGNLNPGNSVPNLIRPLAEWADMLEMSGDILEAEIGADRIHLLERRDGRIRPGRDDKVLTDWNGLMISALVRGYAATGDERYLDFAKRTANRLLRPFEERGALVHSQLGEISSEVQLLLDYAAAAIGLLNLYLATGETRWFADCVALAERLYELFENEDRPYYMSASMVAGERLVDPHDNVLPAGTSLAGLLMARLYYLTDDERYLRRAETQVKSIADSMKASPTLFPQAMETAGLLKTPPAVLVLAGDHAREMWKTACEFYTPDMFVIWMNEKEGVPEELRSLLAGKAPIDGKPTAYLCRNFACELPVHSADALRDQIKNRGEIRP
jgi:uncharacterized protein YyaL (SSP411 family)